MATAQDQGPLFYIQDTRQTVGNAVLWWRVNGQGYTCNLDDAWLVGPDWKPGRNTDVLVPKAVADAAARDTGRIVDYQHLRRHSDKERP